MYLKMATEEDKKMAENWKDDAEGIIIFVRRYLRFLTFIHAKPWVIDRSILRCCRGLDLSVNSGPPAKPTGYI